MKCDRAGSEDQTTLSKTGEPLAYAGSIDKELLS